MTQTAATIVNDGQYRWSIGTDVLARAMKANGYTPETYQGYKIARNPGVDAYGRLCSETSYEHLSSDGQEACAALESLTESGAETMVYRADIADGAWEISSGLYAALLDA